MVKNLLDHFPAERDLPVQESPDHVRDSMNAVVLCQDSIGTVAPGGNDWIGLATIGPDENPSFGKELPQVAQSVHGNPPMQTKFVKHRRGHASAGGSNRLDGAILGR